MRSCLLFDRPKQRKTQNLYILFDLTFNIPNQMLHWRDVFPVDYLPPMLFQMLYNKKKTNFLLTKEKNYSPALIASFANCTTIFD
jgi:hypothetical protein